MSDQHDYEERGHAPDLLTEAEAAEYLRIGLYTLKRIRSQGRINYRKMGQCVRYTHADLAQFLEDAKVPAQPPSDRHAGTPARASGEVPGYDLSPEDHKKAAQAELRQRRSRQ